MSATPVIFDGVWKKFRKGERHDSLRDLIPSLTARLFRRQRSDELETEEFWALRDVSFQVKQGQAVGIIGPNGAGKSTALKLLSRILRPTRGRCEVRGRVGALIEIAAGFHPDLTGRENIYLQGAIMGMKRAEIASKFDEIVEFAGIGPFVDTPVKRYSSGMNARLGFSIAAHVDPQVLLIDEVLSVGDIAFQRRCVERMEKFKKNQGVSIVFVSHNLQAVANLCEHTLYLRGSTRAHGPTPDVIEAYVRDTERHHGTSDRWVSVVSTRLLDDEGRPTAQVTPGMKLTLCVEYLATEAVADLHFGFVVYRSNDLLTVYDRNYTSWELGVQSLAQGQTLQVNFRFRAHLTRGQYHIRCHVFHRPTQEYLSVVSPAGVLTVHEDHTHGGVADLEVQPSVVFLDGDTVCDSTELSSVMTPAAAGRKTRAH